jgi:hypothetical protein
MGKNLWVVELVCLSLTLAGCGQIIHGDDDEGLRASELAITPSPARKGQTLRCDYLLENAEGGEDRSIVRWLVGDVQIAAGTSTLSEGFAGGDTVTCEVTPADGLSTGEPASVSQPVLHGAISGVVYLDADEDGERAEAEVGIAGRTLYLDVDGDGDLDEEEPTAVSDASGAYLFPDVLPGTWQVAQAPGGWRQTFPTVGALYSDDFEEAAVDVDRWSVSGDGVSQTGGVLILNRDDAGDAAVFRPSLGGDAHVTLTVRNTRMNWKDMFHGLEIAGDCDPERNIRGVSFGFSRYGNFFLAQLSCTGATYSYPGAYAIDQWYEIEAVFSAGQIRLLVDGVEQATGQVPLADLGLNLPGHYSDGGAETNTISEVDQVTVVVHSYSHEVELEDGEVADGLDFGSDG